MTPPETVSLMKRRWSCRVNLRGKVIGSLWLKRKASERPWNDVEREMAERIAGQVAFALDNARVLEESQRRAAREQTVSAFSERFSRSLDIDLLAAKRCARTAQPAAGGGSFGLHPPGTRQPAAEMNSESDSPMLQQFFDLPPYKPELPAEKRGLYRLLAAGVPAIVTFQPLIALAMFVIVSLTLAGHLDAPEEIHLLFVVGGINLLNTLLHLPLFGLLRRNRLEAAAFLLVLFDGTLSAAQILLWQGVLWFPLGLVAAIVAVFLIVPGLKRLHRAFILLIGLFPWAATLFIDTQITYPRLFQENLATTLRCSPTSS